MDLLIYQGGWTLNFPLKFSLSTKPTKNIDCYLHIYGVEVKQTLV